MLSKGRRSSVELLVETDASSELQLQHEPSYGFELR